MIRFKRRRFLQSLIPVEVDTDFSSFIHTGFISGNKQTVVSVERTIDLSANGSIQNIMMTSFKHKGFTIVYDSIMNEEDAISLISLCSNKIKKYQYRLNHEENKVFVNRYTLGIVIIEIELNKPLSKLPEYCGIEITDNADYDEVNLILMKNQLREENILRLKNLKNNE